MKRMQLLSLGLIASFLAVVGVATTASAVWSPNFNTADEAVTLAKDATHQGSFYAAGQSVTIDGTITGSLYCVGSTVTINGTVEGDVLCAAQKVTVNGTVGQDVRAAGQFVEIDGTVGGSLTAFGQDVRLGDEASVADDVNGAAQQITLDGVVGRDVAVGTQLFALNGEVKGNVDVAMEQIQLGSDASVAGNLNYSTQRELSFDESGVAGTVSYNPMPEGDYQDSGRQFFSAAKIMFLVMLAASALIAVLVMPRFLNRSSELFVREVPKTVLLGLATVFGLPALVGFLIVSVVLLPVGLALLFAWLTVVLLSGIFFAHWVGSELLRSQQNTIVRMLGGIAVMLVLYMIPFINVLAMFTSLVIGSGMIVTTLSNGYRRPSYGVIETKKKTASKK